MSDYKVSYLQPIFTNYRIPLFKGISQNSKKMTVYAELPKKSFGKIETGKVDDRLELVEIKWINFWIFKIFNIKRIFSLIHESDIIVHFADFKYLTLWICLFSCFFSNKKLYLHGQGGYKKSGVLHSMIYRFIIIFSDGYICYTEFSRDNLLNIIGNKYRHKLHVVDNSLYLPVTKSTPSTDANEILYLGRLRPGCGIELLLNAVDDLKIKVNIIGSSDNGYEKELSKEYPNVIFHGPIFSFDEQLDISKSCFAGVYAGDAGLSVVHYMALGLPVIVHGNIKMHMGPEPSYVEDGYNGLFFERNNIEDFKDKIMCLYTNKDYRLTLSKNSLNTFVRLSSPSMDSKFSKIIGLL